VIEAVIFDLDGVLIDSEQVWASAREQLTRERGGHYRSDSTRAMMGMSAPEWSRYMHDQLGVELAPSDISREVSERVGALYRQHLPLLDGARDAVVSLAERWRLGLASSANREIIDLVLVLAGINACFAATVSAEEVDRGKPAPDVYLRAAEELRAEPARCVAVEDSTNGLRAAHAAAMKLVAVPNQSFPPSQESLELADAVVAGLRELDPALIEQLDDARADPLAGPG
jgi:HAD superfamily hydrolase (TIGR01509 family)